MTADMHGFLGSVGQFLVHGLANIRLAKSESEAIADRLAQALAGGALLPDPANDGRVRSDLHAAGGVFFENTFPFQVRVSLGHHLRIGHKLLGKGAVFGQPGSGPEGPRGDLGNKLAGNLFRHRHRRIRLNIDHDAFEATSLGADLQPPGDEMDAGMEFLAVAGYRNTERQRE
jgi:hypothetical protein